MQFPFSLLLIIPQQKDQRALTAVSVDKSPVSPAFHTEVTVNLYP